MLLDTIFILIGILGSRFIFNQGTCYINASKNDINSCMEKGKGMYTDQLKETHGLNELQVSFFLLFGYTFAFMSERDICNLAGIKDNDNDLENTTKNLCNLNWDRAFFSSLFLSEVKDFNFHLSNNPRIRTIIGHIKKPNLSISLSPTNRVVLNRFIHNLIDRVSEKDKKINWKTIKVGVNDDLSMLESIAWLITSLYKTNKDLRIEELSNKVLKELEKDFKDDLAKLHSKKVEDLKARKEELLIKVKKVPITPDFDEKFEKLFIQEFAGPILQSIQSSSGESGGLNTEENNCSIM